MHSTPLTINMIQYPVFSDFCIYVNCAMLFFMKCQ